MIKLVSDDYRDLWRLCSRDARNKIAIYSCLILFLGIVELIGLSSAYPLLTSFVASLNVNSPSTPDIKVFVPVIEETVSFNFFIICFLLLVVLTTFGRYYGLAASIRLSQRIGIELSSNLFNIVLRNNYSYFVKNPSSDIISTLTARIDAVIGGIVMPVVIIGYTTTICIAMLITLYLTVDPIVLLSIFLIALFYLGIFFFNKNFIVKTSKIISEKYQSKIALVQSSIYGIRDIILSQCHILMGNEFRKIVSELRNAQATVLTISLTPRVLMDGVVLAVLGIAIALMIYLDMASAGLQYLPDLGMLALGGQRLLPLINQMYTSVVSIRNAQHSLADVLRSVNYQANLRVNTDEPELRRMDNSEGLFRPQFEGLTFKQLRYGYSDVCHFSCDEITIRRGDYILLAGASGSGKSSLCDVICGFLEPAAGRVLLNGQTIESDLDKEMQRHVAYVSQNAYLFDGTVIENITFGCDAADIDHALAKECGRITDVFSFLDENNDWENIRIGEDGKSLSGGQRQKLLIARALYLDRTILILDEATSAIDLAGERYILENIKAKRNMTVILVTHRLETSDLFPIEWICDNGNVSCRPT